MGDRIHELGGKAKEGLARLMGNKRLEAEGEAGSQAARTKRKTKRVLREAGGSAKEAVGKLTGDEVAQAEGTEKLRGQAERAG